MARRKRMTLTFEAAPAKVAAGRNDDDRRIVGMAAPYGVPGRTSAGVLRIRPGALRLPADIGRVKLTRGHNRDKPIGVALATRDTRKGLRMEFRPGTTKLAEEAYAECADGLRDALSVELDNMTVRNGWVEDAEVLSVALLPYPAYADARALAAGLDDDEDEELEDDEDDEDEELEDEDDEAEDDEDEELADDADDTDDRDDRGAHDRTGGSMPKQLAAGRRTPRAGGRRREFELDGAKFRAAAPAGSLTAGRKRKPKTPQLRTLFEALSAQHTGEALSPQMQAALSDITHTANEWVQNTQYAGELWSGVQYTRRIVPLMQQLPLTSYKVQGWRWATKPVVATWAGDKADVPSNAAVTEPADTEAERLAGAHDFDRKFRDFGDTGFFESYYRAMTESYAILSDAAAANHLAAEASSAGTAAGLVPAIVAGALAMIDEAVPSFAIVGTDLLADAFELTEADMPALLDLELDLGGAPAEGSAGGGRTRLRVVPHAALNGNVLVGARGAATFYELDPTPIRVEAVDMVKGGIDTGVFGYFAAIVNDADALQLVDATP